jgi:hypothetical protein
MADFAKIVDSIVTQVIVLSNDNFDGVEFPESETIGQTYLAAIGLNGEWLQTSETGEYRGVYAGVGYTYDSALDIFVAPPSPPEPEPIPTPEA